MELSDCERESFSVRNRGKTSSGIVTASPTTRVPAMGGIFTTTTARKDDDDDGADAGLDPDAAGCIMMMLLHRVDLLVNSNHGVP